MALASSWDEWDECVLAAIETGEKDTTLRCCARALASRAAAGCFLWVPTSYAGIGLQPDAGGIEVITEAGTRGRAAGTRAREKRDMEPKINKEMVMAVTAVTRRVELSAHSLPPRRPALPCLITICIRAPLSCR